MQNIENQMKYREEQREELERMRKVDKKQLFDGGFN